MPDSYTEPGAPDAPLQAAGLPGRVRQALERACAVVTEEVARHQDALIDHTLGQLFRQAERARDAHTQARQMQAQTQLARRRSELLPAFAQALQARLAALRVQQTEAEVAGSPGGHLELRLAEDPADDAQALIRDLGRRQQARASLALYLLGQRFGVLAGSRAFDPERVPLGPHMLCECMDAAATRLGLERPAREVLLHAFDTQVLAHYPALAEVLNQTLSQLGILPGLTYVPVRAQPGARGPRGAPSEAGKIYDAAADADPAAPSPSVPAAPAPATAPESDTPATAVGRGDAVFAQWPGMRPGASPLAAPAATGTGAPSPPPGSDRAAGGESDAPSFDALHALLARRRAMLDKFRPAATTPSTAAAELPPQALRSALQRLQEAPPPSSGDLGRAVQDLKQTVLAQARQASGRGAALAGRDADTFELLSLLYAQVSQQLRAGTPARSLLARLQVPVLRVALDDPGFFLASDHPTRQLLNTVAEAGAGWLGEDELDPHWLQQVRQAVELVVARFDGDVAVFAEANRGLQEQQELMAHRAEVSERRHVEAARGRERLARSKQRAGEVLEELRAGRALPRFAATLLEQAWSDVLTLTLLRQGEQSAAWETMRARTAQILARLTGEADTPDPALATAIRRDLLQIGYHAEEAERIAGHLCHPGAMDTEADDAARTALAHTLRQRARLGEGQAGAPRAEREPLPPRTAAEQDAYDLLRTLPFGTWLEFTVNQQGDRVRRRLSWYSTLTDNALFVNQRGQRVAEQTLDSVARLLAAGQARVVTQRQARLLDRAWQATVQALQRFAGQPATAEAGA
ncbi:DUF1631 family protein [Thermomonas flagellata]|uniref:DUF1631 family protein n=1 Tax=Thermomonas flagellata TaxID=2888524 RepID=UPI001F04CC6A|nr:DUF1631 family protein [Thermomonas flagellata]